ncbi:hypothetical protein GOA99_07180 [Sinorhizobium meliloti]|uniref:hypothetical protein n=1 Tax=Sinorhizobium medicae TaxID=110321 RepID=UPI000FE1281D|nr:hypothetical protein [Sinorhizobium medicae]MDW9365806.1 hypothetical protein [Sinorhizobium meliloti]MDW9384490.1 hypothetical protein [Sinorhizobium meliloti]RVI96804.1 hypothetical protein CN183_32655 [Sinorhizobium medicae]
MANFSQAGRDGIWNVLKEGGSYTMLLDADDMQMSDDVVEALGDTLHTGFEMEPTSLIYFDDAASEILRLADGWTAVPVRVYRAGGKIIYKKLSDGRFEARITV